MFSINLTSDKTLAINSFKNYTDLKKAAEDRSVWRTTRNVINLLHKQITE